MKKIKKLFSDRREYIHLLKEFESTLPKKLCLNAFIADGILNFLAVWGFVLFCLVLRLLSK